ncbi:MAG: DEAD/DEAH box helicase family protein, partial [Bacilli bacterium]
NSNLLDVNSTKNIFKQVLYDSIPEETFALEAEADEEVIVYAKLPSKFKIDTPIGTYNPDWALVIREEGQEKVYFVAETKGKDHLFELRGSEAIKVQCGLKHFELIDKTVKYEVVTNLKSLKALI